MAYFPVLIEMQRKHVLLVGGGKIACFKYATIVESGPASLTVVAIDISSQLIKEKKPFVTFHSRAFEYSDLSGIDLVVVAVDDLSLQSEIFKLCQGRKILCNCVDNIEQCDFIFPAIVRRGDITIAISTSGKVPGFSVALKNYINSVLPIDLENKLYELFLLRNSLPRGLERMNRLREESAVYFKKLYTEKLK